MKRLIDLTKDDLTKHPIWLYESDGYDKAAFVQPVSLFQNPNQKAYIAHTKFTLASGKVLFGYCSPTDPSGIDYIQPVIIYNQKHIAFWNDDTVSEIPSSMIANQLQLPVNEIYPIRYEALVPFENAYWQATIEIAV